MLGSMEWMKRIELWWFCVYVRKRRWYWIGSCSVDEQQLYLNNNKLFPLYTPRHPWHRINHTLVLMCHSLDHLWIPYRIEEFNLSLTTIKEAEFFCTQPIFLVKFTLHLWPNQFVPTQLKCSCQIILLILWCSPSNLLFYVSDPGTYLQN